MPKLSVKAGATSVLDEIFIQDSSSTTGAGLTGLTSATSGLVCYRGRGDDGNAGGTVISLTSTGTLGTWASGWFKEKDATNMPGVYEIGYTNASLATGSRFVVIYFKGATNMAPLVLEIELTGWDNQDGVHGGLSCLPNTAVTTNASLITSGSGTDQLTVSGGVASADAKKINAVSTSSVTTVNANIGTTQVVTFNANNFQKVSLNDILATTLTETSGQLAGGFKKWFNVASPTGTLNSIPDFTPGNTSGGLLVNNAVVSVAALVVNGATTLTGAVTATNASNDIQVDVTKVLGTASAGAAGYMGIDWNAINAPTTTQNLSGTTVSTITTLPSIPSNWLTAAGIAASALNGKGDWLLSSSYTAPANAAINSMNGRLPTSPAAVGSVMVVDQSQAVATSNTANTIGDCLNAARAQGFGRWAIVGTTLSLYAPDGTTVVRSFTLDSATVPTSRT